MNEDEFDDGAPVRLDLDGVSARITLAAPDRRNALSPRTLRLLLDAIDEAQDAPEVRVIVLGAEGPVFCAGADPDTADDADLPALFAAVLTAMRDSTKPILVRIQGPVVGGGNGLVAAADIAVASSDATFAFPEVRVGAVPAVVAVACLGRMRPGDLREFALTGERVDAHRARDSGLVQRVVEPEALDAAIEVLVRALALGAPSALAVTRQVLQEIPTMEEDEAYGWTAALSAEVYASADAREGRAAFDDDRSPAWVPERFKGQ